MIAPLPHVAGLLKQLANFDPPKLSYREFLEAKRPPARVYGHPIGPGAAVHPRAKDFQAWLIDWSVRGGRRALFERFGLGKTLQQLEIARLTLLNAERRGEGAWQSGAAGLVVAPLGVRQEFLEEAAKLGIALRFIRTTDEIDGPGIYLTNYESVREGKIDVSWFTVVSLDEAAILRGFGGTKTFREFMRLFDRTPYRFVATATPAPNEYIELLAYAAFLGIMDIGEAKTRFFKRNSEKADELTLHPHKVDEFWLWVNSWAAFVQRPSDLGFSDDGYDLPPMSVEWIQVDAAGTDPGTEKDGQGRLLHTESMGVQRAAAEKRATMPARVAMVRTLVEASPDEHVVIWHDLEDERRALEADIPGIATVYGSQDLDEREATIAAFKNGTLARVGAKPVMFGAGGNLQRHCAWAIFAGVGFKFADLIQAVHRIYRFGQTRSVRITIVHGASEVEVVRELQRKWADYDRLMARMSELIRRYGLGSTVGESPLVRTIGCERRECRGERFTAINADCVEETMAMAADSVGLVLTSIPFGTQYEYTPSYNDFGHTDDDEHFFAQMDYLTPELFRVLQPGRKLIVHVKDRVRPGSLDGIGYQHVMPFHAFVMLHFLKHGFTNLGKITIATDVVRENAQTYRLGWSMQCDDASRMGVGLPEYLLIFRKPPSDASDGYADVPVEKSKSEYSRGRWQTDAHQYWRSNGNRPLCGDDLVGLDADQIFKRFRAWTFATVYDYEQAVEIADTLDAAKRLPPSFQLLQPASWHPEIWTDIARMRGMNTLQSQDGRELHLCPLPFDIVGRCVSTQSNPGDVVYDPFGGLMTVPYTAVKLGRRGLGVELNPRYFDDGVRYLQALEESQTTPTLFDLLEAEASEAAD